MLARPSYLRLSKMTKPYLDLLRHVLDHGERRTDRTGVGTISVFGAQARYDLREGFPLLTTKKVPFSSVVKELLWFLSGSTNVHDLDSPIWNEWAGPDGDLGPIYGHQWRSWGMDLAKDSPDPAPSPFGVDQISEALSIITTNPDSRRIVVSAWNVADVPRMRLPPCHLLFQFYVSSGLLIGTPPRYLDCQLYQRSADMMLGVPFSVASYALLLSMFAKECDLVPRYFIHTLGDAHVYLNHLDGAREQLARYPLPPPRLVLADKRVLEQRLEDVKLEDYRSHPAIKFQVAV
jgi:thymidylate synthase